MKTRRRGFTLIELNVMIAIISVGLAGVMLAMNTAVKGSADPMVRKQMLSIAEGMLAEILGKAFDDPAGDCTPTTVPSCRLDTLADRPNYNDVSDYQGFQTTGIYRQDGTAAAGLEGYNIDSVAIDPAVIGGVGATAIDCGSSAVLPIKRITVTVSHGAEQLALSGYRTCYDRP